jgi:hypothetical protein
MSKRTEIQAGLTEYAEELEESERIYWEVGDCSCCCCTGEGH